MDIGGFSVSLCLQVFISCFSEGTQVYLQKKIHHGVSRSNTKNFFLNSKLTNGQQFSVVNSSLFILLFSLCSLPPTAS